MGNRIFLPPLLVQYYPRTYLQKKGVNNQTDRRVNQTSSYENNAQRHPDRQNCEEKSTGKYDKVREKALEFVHYYTWVRLHACPAMQEENLRSPFFGLYIYLLLYDYYIYYCKK